MKVVIFSHEKDYHAKSVVWGLQEIGVEAKIIPTICHDTNNPVTYKINEGSICCGNTEITSADSIWLRRPQIPTPYKGVVNGDLKFVKNELREVLLSVFHHIENTSFCINKYSSEYSIDRKPEQLKLAKKVGLTVPDSVITNSPSEARKFLKKIGGKCIYKTLTPHVWESPNYNTLSIAKAALVDELSLKDDFTVKSCPLLLQKFIHKKYDVRITVMGKRIDAVTFISKDGNPPVDWRPAYQESSVILQEVSVPQNIRTKIIDFMRKAGLVFGTMDFSVDRDDTWWFLEINTQGQFLWTEQEVKLGLLENFCHFLSNKDPDFEGVENAGDIINHEKFIESEAYKSLLESGAGLQDQTFYSMEK